MPKVKVSKQQLEKLAQQITQDQSRSSPAEKPVKINTSFKRAVKKMVRTPPPKK